MSRSKALAVAAAIGIGLVAAPALFQMFTRAPLGGEMIDEFTPYMTAEVMSDFRGYLDVIGASVAETQAIDPDSAPTAVADLNTDWPEIDAEMNTLLDTMDANVDNFDAVAALPPFPLFPWFFVVPGVMVATIGVIGARRSSRTAAAVIAVIGIGLVAAPAAFQMFTRAPKGGQMLTELGPYMTTEKVREVQGYFLTLGAAEGALRHDVLPASGDTAPATREFVDLWPTISNEMAPMVGVMADNLDNFAAVDALPPFPLFPWFFVVPGVMLAGLGAVARRDRDPAYDPELALTADVVKETL